jgi:GNAT superfamily N-acetyltransferase
MQIIKKIPSSATYLVRQIVLRAGKPIESCRFDGDDLETTLHFGLYLDKVIVGIISLFEKTDTRFNEKRQYQVRGMAVLEDQRQKGIGRALLIHCEKQCNNENADLIWFNARIEAVGFYEKMGYQKKGIPFEISNIGVHIIMFKKT